MKCKNKNSAFVDKEVSVVNKVVWSHQAFYSLLHQQVSRFNNCDENVWFASVGLVYLLRGKYSLQLGNAILLGQLL